MFKKSTVTLALIGSSMLSFFPQQDSLAISLLVSSGSQVGEIDTATGAFTPLNTAGPSFTDIALRESGEVYGNTFNSLYLVDLDTNTNTFIGNFNISGGINALGFSNSDILYGTTIEGGFYSIDVNSGSGSLISNIPGFSSAGDIVFNPDSNEFLATSTSPSNSTLFSIALDGTATQIGSIGFGNVYGIFFEDQTLYGYTGNNQQIIIDLDTGLGTFDSSVTGISGSIFGAGSLPSTGPTDPSNPNPPNPNPTSTPEPASILSLLSLGILGGVSRLKSTTKK